MAICLPAPGLDHRVLSSSVSAVWLSFFFFPQFVLLADGWAVCNGPEYRAEVLANDHEGMTAVHYGENTK